MTPQKMAENDFQDYLFENYKENFLDLVVGVKEPLSWDQETFPTLQFVLQQLVETKINNLLDSLKTLVFLAKELPLKKHGYSTTRVDLFGYSDDYGIVIIELKISKPTERQSFTELLAYSNHFCSIFPSLHENNIMSILIAPLESRTVKDAFVQELLVNRKNILTLTPNFTDDGVELQVYYPDASYFRWYENHLLNDQFMSTVAVSFPELPDWIPVDSGGEQIPIHSEKALNTISSSIAARLESEDIHALVYASQKWGEIASLIPYPNTIYIAALNPLSLHCNDFDDCKISDDISKITDKLCEDLREYWLEDIETSFDNYLIKVVESEFDFCFQSYSQAPIEKEISCPDWLGTKIDPMSSIFTHQLDIYLTGMLRLIYQQYISHIYKYGVCQCYFSDDLPVYSYGTLRHFLAVWEILRGISMSEEDPDDDDTYLNKMPF